MTHRSISLLGSGSVGLVHCDAGTHLSIDCSRKSLVLGISVH